MAEFALHHRKFDIRVNINGTEETLTVSPDETTDGIEFFNCLLKDKKITQMRSDESGKWEQMWGELDQDTINQIGAAINPS